MARVIAGVGAREGMDRDSHADTDKDLHAVTRRYTPIQWTKIYLPIHSEKDRQSRQTHRQAESRKANKFKTPKRRTLNPKPSNPKPQTIHTGMQRGATRALAGQLPTSVTTGTTTRCTRNAHREPQTLDPKPETLKSHLDRLQLQPALRPKAHMPKLGQHPNPKTRIRRVALRPGNPSSVHPKPFRPKPQTPTANRRLTAEPRIPISEPDCGRLGQGFAGSSGVSVRP